VAAGAKRHRMRSHQQRRERLRLSGAASVGEAPLSAATRWAADRLAEARRVAENMETINWREEFRGPGIRESRRRYVYRGPALAAVREKTHRLPPQHQTHQSLRLWELTTVVRRKAVLGQKRWQAPPATPRMGPGVVYETTLPLLPMATPSKSATAVSSPHLTSTMAPYS